MKKILATVTTIWLAGILAYAQTTGFTYQGSLKDGANSANGNYDFEFALYDGTGVQIAPTLQRNSVAVVNGVFSVSLDFGNQFPGSGRLLEIRVKASGGGGGFTTLAPRQPVTSSPYAVKSLNSDTAANFSGSLTGDVTGTQTGTLIAANAVNTTKLADSAVTAAKIANGQVVRSINGLTDNVTLAAGANVTITPSGNTLTIASTGGGAGNAILNQTSPQAGANFNISGTGTANVFNAVSQYNINGAGRILASPGSNNLFVGIAAGSANASGSGNTFVGGGAGSSNTSGGNNTFVGANAGTFNSSSSNSFFGAAAGFSNASGSFNAFFGESAGQNNNNGSNNSFFGRFAGRDNISGFNNSFFGAGAGLSNKSSSNSFFGAASGGSNTSGSFNTFVGSAAGQLNEQGDNNSFFGANAGQNNTGNNNSVFGANAGQSNSSGIWNSFFGSGAGVNNTMGSSNSFVGYSAGKANLNGLGNSFFGKEAGLASTSGDYNTILGWQAGATNITGNNVTLVGATANVATGNLQFATAIGAGSTVSTSNTVALGRSNGSDAVQIYGIAGFGSFQLCLTATNLVAGCSSSFRYKKNIGRFLPGMSFVNQLRPITFDWKDTGMKDVGFGAEDVEKIDPRFVTYNKQGQVEGVKYDRLSVAFVNALNEQQAQIRDQALLIDRQGIEIGSQRSAINEQQKQIATLLSANAAMNARLQRVERKLRTKHQAAHRMR